MRNSRHSFTVYPPCYRPGMRYFTVNSVFQAKKKASKLGTGTEVWRYTRRGGRNDDPCRNNTGEAYLAFSSSSDFEFEVV